MPSLSITNAWPEDLLPSPFINYSGQLRVPTLVSEASAAAVVRRKRFQTIYNSIAVKWNFTLTEYDDFQTFVQDTLGNGTASFTINLKYPENSVLTGWQVRFASEGWEATYMDVPRWEISATLDLIQPTTLGSATRRTGWSLFFDSNLDNVFLDGLEFFVKEP